MRACRIWLASASALRTGYFCKLSASTLTAKKSAKRSGKTAVAPGAFRLAYSVEKLSTVDFSSAPQVVLCPSYATGTPSIVWLGSPSAMVQPV